MDLVKMLRSLEDAVYEIIAWVMLLPKTFLRVATRPDWVPGYVNDEFKKESAERFDDYLSPVIFWVLVAVVPVVLLAPDEVSARSEFMAAIEESNLLEAALIALVTPMVYMIWMEWLNKRPIKRSTLKRQFYIQCYLVSPVQAAYTLLVRFVAPSSAFTFLSAAIVGLVIFYQLFAFRDELKVGLWKAAWLASVPQIVLLIGGIVLGMLGIP
jgi:hypothetical protein